MPFPKKPQKKRNVYLDHAATTPLDPLVFAAMKPFLTGNFANPSALYASAVAARNMVEGARKRVAKVLGTQPNMIVFTGSGTESNNVALLGVARYFPLLPDLPANRLGSKARQAGEGPLPQQGGVVGAKQRHIITTVIEHHAVLNPIKQLEKEGSDASVGVNWKVTYLPVNKEGLISIEDFKKALRPETVLVSIMYANNEVGSIQPIGDIGREILKWRKVHNTPYPYFHTDACQAAAYLDLHVDRLHVDLMSMNGSKIYGPNGTGMLYKRRGVELELIMYGGGQEFGLRSGTENLAGIVGFAKALELASKYRNIEILRLTKLCDYFWKEIQEAIPDVILNGPSIVGVNKKKDPSPRRRGQGEVSKGPMSPALNAAWGTLRPPPTSPYQGEHIDRLPNNLNVTFKNTDAEALILYLDEYGIQCSSGSACTTDSDEVSHVLLACGLSEEDAKSSIRFTLGKSTTKKDIDYVMKYLPDIIQMLRSMGTV